MKRILVTGASRGIGHALVKALLERGDEVYAAVRSVGDLAAPAESLEQWPTSDRLHVIEMDVSASRTVASARAAMVVDSLDIVVNNAGVSGPPQHAPGFDLERVEQVFQVNAIGAVRVYDAFADLLRKSTNGWLINIGSEAGSLTHFRLGSKPEYGMSKAALSSFTQWVAGHENGAIRCAVIDPGWTLTSMGGTHATHTPRQTADALIAAFDRLTPEHSGRFFNVDLSPAAW